MGGQERDRRECVGKYITAQKGGIIAKVLGGGGLRDWMKMRGEK